MIMWLFILAAVLIVFSFSVFYLMTRIKKFSIVKKLSKDSRKKSWLISAGVLLAGTVLLTLFLSLVNAIICIIHLVIVWLICELIAFIIKKIRKKDMKRYYAGAAAFIFTFGYMGVGWYFAHKVYTTKYSITTQKDVNDLRIVQFSDSHIGSLFDAEDFSEYVDRMQAEDPDVVLITGDFVDDGTSREDMLGSCEALSRFHPTYGVYFAYGNHDRGYFDDESRGWTRDELADEMRKNGVTILEDSSVQINKDYYIIGRRDASEKQIGSGRLDIHKLSDPLDKSKFVIVMDHQPNDYILESEAGVDLVLSGHTHGGQFFPITAAGEWMGANDRTYGYERRLNTDFIVSSGIADWEIKFKTGCVSEYNVIDVSQGSSIIS